MSGSDEGKLPMMRFEGHMLPPRERLAAWSELTPGYDKILPPGVAPEDFEVDCRAWLLEDLVITSNHCSPIELVRSPAHILGYARDTYTLVLLKQGQWRADLDYGGIQVGSGQVCIMDFTVPWHVYGGRQDNIMIVLPRTVLTAATSNAPRLHGRLLEGASGRLFAEHMLALERHLPELDQRDTSLVRNTTIALLSSAVSALPKLTVRRSSSTRAGAIGRARSYIDEHLTDPDLSIDRICREVAVTRATLYRAFQTSKGVAGYILCRRLEAAHARLSDHSDQMNMASIAELFCFSSAAYFSTAFKRQFGYTPREAKGSAPQARDALPRQQRRTLRLAAVSSPTVKAWLSQTAGRPPPSGPSLRYR
jgi:AraC-like DNA-binding protein